MVKAGLAMSGIALALAACARAEATRTSQNTMIIEAGAAPTCGSAGAARVANRSAAVETIKAGYDRYIITGANAQNNVSVTQMPGQVQTFGTVQGGTINATSTYVPGPTIVYGNHSRALAVVMYRNGEPGAAQALDAREALGPEWREIVKNPTVNCLG